MRLIALMMAALLGSAGANAMAEGSGAAVLIKPDAVFDPVDGKRHPGWQVLVRGRRSSRSAPISPRRRMPRCWRCPATR